MLGVLLIDVGAWGFLTFLLAGGILDMWMLRYDRVVRNWLCLWSAVKR